MHPILRLAILCALFAGCDGMGSGVIVTNQGQFLANTPAGQRTRMTLSMQREIDEQMDGTWRCLIAITELPVYNNDPDTTSEAWTWPRASMHIELVGMSAASPNPQDQVVAALRAYMRTHVDRPDRNLTIDIQTKVDANRFAVVKAHPGLAPFMSPPSEQAPTVAAAPPPAVSSDPKPATTQAPLNAINVPVEETSIYIVQEGDTLANISVAFYGTNQNWRLILKANPCIEDGVLHVGQKLVIPPKP